MKRPSISRPLKRDVLVEAGHRCAIPACRQVPVEIAHIDDWSKVKKHTFDNLIALCPTCHTRYDNNEIDRQSMMRYKANLSIVNNRYGDFEKRILFEMADKKTPAFILPGGRSIDLMYLINDGLLECATQRLIKLKKYQGSIIDGIPSKDYYKITSKGREFIEKWIAGKDIEN